MKFTPKTDKQIAEEGLIASGTIADFEVIEGKEATSRAGNPMIALQVKVWRDNGTTTLVRDWLLLDQMWKLRAFAECVGILDQYEAGEIDPFELKGLTGKAKIGIKPASGEYPAGNSIAGYIKREGATAPKAAPKREPVAVDDEIPF